jgi:hypothetical protein
MFESVPTGQPDYTQGAEIACRASATTVRDDQPSA